METHLLRLEISSPPVDEPLFNHEAVYKTVKGYFHDLKEACLTREEYGRAGPLFLYSVDRGSGIWNFLGELRQILLLGTTLADEKVMGQRLKNLDKQLGILKKHFGRSVTPEIFEAFVKARSPRQLDRAVGKLFEQGIKRIAISTKPFKGNVKQVESSLVDLKKIMKADDDK